MANWKYSLLLALALLSVAAQAEVRESAVGSLGELAINLKGGQVERCAFADDSRSLLYVPRAGYDFGTAAFKQGGVALVRTDGSQVGRFRVDRRIRAEGMDGFALVSAGDGSCVRMSAALASDRLSLTCDDPLVLFLPYLAVSDAAKVRLENTSDGCRLVDPGWNRTVVITGGGTWRIDPATPGYPTDNLHELEMASFVRLRPTAAADGLKLSFALEGKGAVSRPEPVADVTKWLGHRAALRDLVEREAYGRRPVERPTDLTFARVEPDCVMMEGCAVRKRIRASWTGPYADADFTFTAFVPNRPGPHPAFLLICNRDPKKNIDPTRTNRSDFWPAEQIVARGYAALAFWNGDIAPDDNSTNFVKGVYRCWRKDGSRTPDSWGALSAWAWGASRVMDWVETEPTLNARRVAVVGHSRGGKTALLVGAFDERFAMCCPNDAGMGGDKLNHIDLPASESLAVIQRAFPHWFCGNYAKYAGRDRDLPFDQHELVALVAPRLVAIGSAAGDYWAGPLGQYWSARLASPMWEAQGLKGLEPKTMPIVIGGAPAPGTCLQEGSISFHCRAGGHNLTAEDWNRFMDFADRQGWQRKGR